ncbi:MAG: RNA polymerase subunit sigma-70 [Agathobacter sp.]
MRLNKKVLEEYIDACKLVEETEKDIRNLEKRQNAVQQDSVQASNPEFPYQMTHVHIEGIKASVERDARIRYEKSLLEVRKKKAEQIKLEVQQLLNEAPPRIQRIIRMKYFEGYSWEKVAKELGRKATADSVRMELTNFLK